MFLISLLSGCTIIGRERSAALQVTSNPEASIFLDGKHVGKTPFFSDQLKEGKMTLKISASEAVYSEEISLNAGTLLVINRDLANRLLAQSGESLHLEPKSIGLAITTNVDDAQITIDGKYFGVPPLFTKDLTDGEHKVQVSKKGYLKREFSIKTSNKYQLMAQVTLASEIAKSGVKTPQISEKPANYLEILDTPQGFLRIREEPSLGAQEIARVNSASKVEVIEEIQDWAKIIFERKIGWISKEYTKKI